MHNPNNKPEYINFYFFSISVKLLFCYTSLISSISLNIVNRLIFKKHNFQLNFTLILLQQLFSLLFFTNIGPRFNSYGQKVGKISISEFKSKARYLFLFSALFITNIYVAFLASKKVNSLMFPSL
jgi:hypothetical protein